MFELEASVNVEKNILEWKMTETKDKRYYITFLNLVAKNESLEVMTVRQREREEFETVSENLEIMKLSLNVRDNGRVKQPSPPVDVDFSSNFKDLRDTT